MSAGMRIVMAQLNLPVGDVAGNARKLIAAAAESRDRLQAQLVVFPELCLTGYTPEDLLFNPDFRGRVDEGLKALTAGIRGIRAVVGYPFHEGGKLYNVGAVVGEGKIQAVYRKSELPNYGVFDEQRYFTPSDDTTLIDVGGYAVGLNVCEDVWHAAPARRAAEAGARLIVVPNASPFNVGKQVEREAELKRRVAEVKVPIVYVNHVGGQDSLVFDGGSLAMNADGTVAARAPDFEEGLYPVDFLMQDGKARALPAAVHIDKSVEESVYRALVLGLRDYAAKNRFRGALLGLSGGIDSALTLALAVDALGAGNVNTVMLPSRHTSKLSLDTAKQQARAMGVEHRVIPIEPAFEALKSSLDQVEGVTDQNLQARARGTLLMALSNQGGRLLLATGNKSEMAMGYATLYGDMAGGYAPLKDVLKTWVYRLSRYRNGLSAVIPQEVIDREPTAELAPGQKDTDNLPPYEVLDAILAAYVDEDKALAEIVAMGYAQETVRWVMQRVQAAEYKRRQAPPGPRVSRCAFGSDRRYPITNRYETD
ncbi:MAG: NAD+ synthase [Bacillota bacterium]